MIRTRSVREFPSREDGLRVLILGFEGVLGTEVFSNVILSELPFDEEAVPLRPSLRRLNLYSEGWIEWQSFEELYRAEICRSRAYSEIERYATLSRAKNVTFVDMCDDPRLSLRRIVA
ncbi:MAG: hypothetical protein HGB18_04830 [Candidatus Moranbacteria bacterium]|nr:hypothetical protein [Candidatus Moranbacteria bacterium]